MTQKIIIDADPGVGDAIAIALALFDPDIDLIGMTATAGSVSGREASRNIQAILEQLDPPKWPRLGVSDLPCPLKLPQFESPIVKSSDADGTGRLGSELFSVAELHSPRESAKLMIDLVRDQPHEITLLTLGPLTNVEIAIERSPNFLNQLKGLVCLGGAIGCGGDVTATSEFNIYANPEAARTVLRFPATKTLVPLDVSNRAVLDYQRFDRLSNEENRPISQLFREILPSAFRAQHQHFGIEGIRLNEVVALASIVHPRLFERQPMSVDIETSGELTRGMTVFDRRDVDSWQTNIEVIEDVDVQGILDYFTRLTRAL